MTDQNGENESDDDEISASEAARQAALYLSDLAESDLLGAPEDIRLEGIKKKEDNWLVTLGWSDKREAEEPPATVTGATENLIRGSTADQVRVYKDFVVDAKSGSVKEMRDTD